jgi:hypothetical protein
VSTNFLRYNPVREDYTLTPDELTALQHASGDISKDVCLVAFSLGVPCLINGIAGTKTPFVLDVALFLNYLFGVIGIFLAIIFGFQWRRSSSHLAGIIEGIKNKPKYPIDLSVSTINATGAATPTVVMNMTEENHKDVT